MLERITSVKNDRIKHLVRLRDRSHRKRQKLFIIEGFRELNRAIKCSWPIETFYFCEDLFTAEESLDLMEQMELSGRDCYALSEAAFRKAAFRSGPDGILAVAKERHWELGTLPMGSPPLLVVVEGIEKPGNLGAIFRSCNAAGVDAVILAAPQTDPYNPNAIRASQGAVFDLPFAIVEAPDARSFLQDNEISPVLLRPDAKSLLWDTDLRGPTALVFGAEDTGLSAEWSGMPNALACRLPMSGVSDSLNVSATTAITLFEGLRQRCQPSA